MTHYLMNDGTACGANGPAVRAQALVSCPACLAHLTRWNETLRAAKTAWAERIA